MFKTILGLVLIGGGIVIVVTEVWPKDRVGAPRTTRLLAGSLAAILGFLVFLA